MMTVEELLEKQNKIERNLELDLRKLEYLFVKSNTTSKINKIIYDLALFSDIYKMCYPDLPNEYLSWEKSRKLSMVLDDKVLDIYNQFNKNVIINNKLYNNMSSNVMKCFSDYPFYKYLSNKIQGYSNKVLNESMYEFLNSYDSKLCKMFKDKINNCEIFYSLDLNKDDGETSNIDCLKKNFITLKYNYRKNIDDAVSTMHEFGHSYEHEVMYGRNMPFLADATPFFEVCSCFFEYAYMNYLRENKLLDKDIKIIFDLYYKNILLYNMDIYTISNYIKKSDTIDIHEEFINVNDEEIWLETDKVKDKLNYYMFSKNREPLDLRETYIYGIGKLFAVILYDSYKNDPNNFKKEFVNTLCNYPLTKDISAFSNLGINEDELINGNILKKRLKKDKEWYNERVY